MRTKKSVSLRNSGKYIIVDDTTRDTIRALSKVTPFKMSQIVDLAVTAWRERHCGEKTVAGMMLIDILKEKT